MKKRNILSFGLLGITLLSSQFVSNENIVVNNSLKTEENNNYVCEVVTGNMNTIGSKYTCTFDDGVPRTFYLLEDGDNTTLIKGSTGTAGPGEVSLILNMNKTNETTAWNIAGTTIDGPVTANEFLKNSTSEWKNVVVSLPAYEQINNIVKANSDKMPAWLYESGSVSSNSVGYWTSTYYYTEHTYSAPSAWYVTSSGDLLYYDVAGNLSVRPVITVSKSLINDSVAKEDTKNKITLSAINSSVLSGSTELKVENIATDSEIYTEIKKYITNTEKIRVYDINLYENGNKIQPNGKVTLTFEVENIDVNKLKVYRMNDDKTYTKIDSKIVDNKIQIEVDHFSIYILTEEEINTNNDITTDVSTEDQVENPNTGEKIIYVTSMSILVILLIASIIVKLKKDKKEY